MSQNFVKIGPPQAEWIHHSATWPQGCHHLSKVFFFRLTNFFFKEQLLFSFSCIVKQKKNFGAIRKFLKIFIFENLLHKKCLKGGISIYADFGPPRYVLWCCGGICHEVLTFIQIGYGHTVTTVVREFNQLQKLK